MIASSILKCMQFQCSLYSGSQWNSEFKQFYVITLEPMKNFSYIDLL